MTGIAILLIASFLVAFIEYKCVPEIKPCDRGGDEMLVIRCNMQADHLKLKCLRNIFTKQAKEGVVVLPCFCEAIVVPDDVEIRVEGVTQGDATTESQ